MPKHNKPWIGKRPHGNGGMRKPSRQELIQKLFRAHKRELIRRGIIQDPATRPPRYKFSWQYGALSGVVYADDRSTARALIKRELGIRKKNRLPKEVDITRELNIETDDDEDSIGGVEEDSDSFDHRREACEAV